MLAPAASCSIIPAHGPGLEPVPALSLALFPRPQIAKAAGLSSTFVNRQAHGLGAITITGWVAFLSVAALVVVVLALAGFGLYKFMGWDQRQHRYTRVVKDGGV